MSNSLSAAEPKYRDVAGIAISTLCAIHCAAIPLLLATGAASGLAWLYEEGLEWGFLGVSALMGCASLIPAYRRVHHRRTCLALFVAGVLSIFAGRISLWGAADTPFVVFGAAMIMTGHVTNQVFCRSCHKCGGLQK